MDESGYLQIHQGDITIVSCVMQLHTSLIWEHDQIINEIFHQILARLSCPFLHTNKIYSLKWSLTYLALRKRMMMIDDDWLWRVCHRVSLPYDHTYQHVFQYGINTKLRSTVLPLSVIWSSVGVGIDSLWVTDPWTASNTLLLPII